MAYDLSTYQEQVGKIQKVITKTSNIFKLLKQESMENKHSIFLSWLFNKDASHGFDERFGQAFFDTCF